MVYVEPIQEAGVRAVKKKHFEKRISISEIVRQGIDLILEKEGMRGFTR